MNLWTLRHRLVTIFSFHSVCVYVCWFQAFLLFYFLFSYCFVVAGFTPFSLNLLLPIPRAPIIIFLPFFDIWMLNVEFPFWFCSSFSGFFGALSVAPSSFVILIILLYQRAFVVIKQNGPTEKHTHKIETMKAKKTKKNIW